MKRKPMVEYVMSLMINIIITTKLSLTRLCSMSCKWSSASFNISLLGRRSMVTLRLARYDNEIDSLSELWLVRRKWIRPRRSAKNQFIKYQYIFQNRSKCFYQSLILYEYIGQYVHVVLLLTMVHYIIVLNDYAAIQVLYCDANKK